MAAAEVLTTAAAAAGSAAARVEVGALVPTAAAAAAAGCGSHPANTAALAAGAAAGTGENDDPSKAKGSDSGGDGGGGVCEARGLRDGECQHQPQDNLRHYLDVSQCYKGVPRRWGKGGLGVACWDCAHDTTNSSSSSGFKQQNHQLGDEQEQQQLGRDSTQQQLQGGKLDVWCPYGLVLKEEDAMAFFQQHEALVPVPAPMQW